MGEYVLFMPVEGARVGNRAHYAYRVLCSFLGEVLAFDGVLVHSPFNLFEMFGDLSYLDYGGVLSPELQFLAFMSERLLIA